MRAKITFVFYNKFSYLCGGEFYPENYEGTNTRDFTTDRKNKRY